MSADGVGPSLPSSAILTFLVADIRGYTAFTRGRGDEAAARLASVFAQIVGEGVEAHGGRLVELRGDEALVIFASARQALRAAAELQSAFVDETGPDLPLRVGIGVDSGEAVPVGDGYRGAALNFAARLCSIAGPGEIKASASLVHLAGQVDGLRYDAGEPATFKGYSEPVPVFGIVATGVEPPAADAAGPAAAPLSIAPPLPPELDPIVPIAGREAELRWLRWHWRRARLGHSRTVIISGPPGIGKTRLAAEIAGIAHEDGATIRYVPAARLAADLPTLLADSTTDRPFLTVIDDLDAAAIDAGRSLVEHAGELVDQGGLLVVTHRLEAPPQLVAVAERLARQDQRMTLGPVDAAAVRTITAMYAGHSAGEAPIAEIVTESGGVPAAVHRVASHWARTSAARRLAASADQTRAGRTTLRGAEAALIDDVADLELARERERLYITDAGEDGVPGATRSICPYKGLAAFEMADEGYYFGRERLVAELIARFVGGTFLGLVGDSGSGKSSALRAGLLPALSGGVLPGSDSWPQVVLRPGEHPIDELGRALARSFPDLAVAADDPSARLDAALRGLAPGQRLVLGVDQFEELFHDTRDDAERSAFIDLLTRERPGLKVVVALRADHYGRCAPYPALARLLAANQVLVGPLSAAELAAVIEHPAQRVGLRVEPELTEALLADAGLEASVLPLLSTTLLELWGARESGRLTAAAYRASGGLQGSISRLAESTYATLDPHRQGVARALLLRLAGPGEGTELVRRRVSLDELDTERDPVIGEVLATLTQARLLTTGDAHVEVAHEALLREWPRLQEWLAEDAAGRQVRLHLTGAARDWQARGAESGDLYRGARLATALEWASEHQLELNASERAFLDASRAASEQEVERQRRTNRRLRVLLVGAAGLLVVAVSAAGFAFLQGQRAEQQRQAAVTAQQSADDQRQVADQQRQAADTARQSADQATVLGRSRELMASAVAAREQDPSLSKLLALEALKLNDQPTYQSTTVLHQVIAADPIIARYHWTAQPDSGQLWTQISPSGDLMIAGNRDDYFEVADPRTGSVLWSDPGGGIDAGVGAPYFSADGSKVLAGLTWDSDQHKPPSDGLGIVLLDARTGQLARRIDVGPCGGEITAVSNDRLLVRSPAQGTDGLCGWPDAPPLRLVNLSSGSIRTLANQDESNETLSGDGRFAAYDVPAGATTRSVVVNVDTGASVFELDSDAVISAFPGINPGVGLLNNDGSLLLYADRPMLVYSVAAGSARPIARLSDAAGSSTGAVFDPTGQNVFATFRDGSLLKMDARFGRTISTWPAVGAGQPSVAADGRTVLVADPATGSAALLDGGIRGDVWDVPTCPGFVLGGSLTIEHGSAAFLESCVGGTTDNAQIVDLKQRKLIGSHPGWGPQQLVLSPDGASVVGQEFEGGHNYGPLAVADASTGSVKVELQGMCRWSNSSMDGCAAYPATPFAYAQRTIRWSPDGSMIAAVDQGTQVTTVWDARDGRLLHADALTGGHGVADILFSPDSKELVEAHPGGVIETVSTDTWTTSNENTLDQSISGLNSIGIAGYLPDGSSIIGIGGLSGGGGASIMWIDPTTLRVVNTVAAADFATPKSTALSPDGAALAIGASDGSVRIWDVATRRQLQQMQLNSQVQGLAFIDDTHLAATPQDGDLLVMTIDPKELVDSVRASITRPFTQTECTTYGIDPCPTLDEIKAP